MREEPSSIPPTSMRPKSRRMRMPSSPIRRRLMISICKHRSLPFNSSVLFRPDNTGDLIFNGVASRVDRDIFSNGLALDASHKLTDQHTLRGGFLFSEQHATVGTATLVFPVDANGNQSSDVPLRIVDDH